MGTTERSTPATHTDTRSSVAHHFHCVVLILFLLPGLYPSLLAATCSISSFYPHIFRGFDGWKAASQIRISTPIESMVRFCLILSSSATQNSFSCSNTKVHLRVPSSWHHLARRFCGFWYWSSGLFRSVSWDYQHSIDLRLQFPYSAVPRLCSGHGSCFSVERVNWEHPLARWS